MSGLFVDSSEASVKLHYILGGEGGIRTLGTVARTLVFETSQFNHSCTSPCSDYCTRCDGVDLPQIL
jgi:hypothetical protein